MKKLPKNILLLLTFVCWTSIMFAQKTAIKGQVVDADTNETLPFANVYFTDNQQGTTTNLDGNFSLTTDDLNLKKITVVFLGYQEKTVRSSYSILP